MADGCYNPIYSVLVENEQDTLGIIAYSLYQRQKIEFIQAFKVKHDREPKDEDLAPFHDVSNSPTQLESYRNQASQLAQGFLDASLAGCLRVYLLGQEIIQQHTSSNVGLA